MRTLGMREYNDSGRKSRAIYGQGYNLYIIKYLRMKLDKSIKLIKFDAAGAGVEPARPLGSSD